MNQKLIDTLLGIADTTTDSYTKKHINHLVDCIILGNQEPPQPNQSNLSASEILKKYEDSNEMHLHDVDRKWIIESMEEYAQQALESYKGGWISELDQLEKWIKEEAEDFKNSQFKEDRSVSGYLSICVLGKIQELKSPPQTKTI